ncbi:MAG: zinc ribbon domain-containing protein [Hyphomonadaceae bacterium]
MHSASSEPARAAGDVAAKDCPRCHAAVPVEFSICPECRYHFAWQAIEARQPKTKHCPRCREEIAIDARACRWCGTDFFTLRMRQFGAVLIIVTLVALVATCARFS